MGRLEDIAARNRDPRWFKGQVAFGLRSLFLLVVLGLLLFTSWALSPPDDRPGINVTLPKDPAVRDVKLWTAPRRPAPPADAGK
ncbi:MAG: hypothetical protein H0T89_35165 [Deltaproteobacteria bacterium]|nr:hypothetical protein [Deltaproteobacteria bacterium]